MPVKLLFAAAAALVVSSIPSLACADEPAPPPRRSVPLIIAGASGLSAGLTVIAVSGIFAATQPCVTFPGMRSGCDPAFDNTYVAPLILVGGIVTVLSVPLFSIGLERDTGPVELAALPTLHVGAGSARVVWEF